MRLRRLSTVFPVFLVLVAACSASTTGPSNAPPAPAPASPWRGTDLLWDALGSSSGFTAVGNSGVVVTSSDGHTWQQQPRVTPQTLRGIASDGKTVATVGTGGVVVTWPAGDPAAAQAHSAGVPITLLGVANGNGTWVIGGSGGTVLSSSDLLTWDEHASGTDGDIFAMSYGAGHFVAVTDIGSIATSSDGSSWTTTRQPDGTWLWGVTYGADGFIAVGANGTVLRSPDGLAWARETSGTPQVLRGVVYGQGRYFAVGSDSVAVSSPDGVTWSAVNVGDQGVELWRPAVADGQWLAVGAGGTRLVSPDLTMWSGGVTTRTAFYGVGSNGGTGSNGSTVLAAGVNGTIDKRRPDGTWQTIANDEGKRELRSVRYLGSVWVATGGGGTILTSTDGTSFTQASSGSAAELWSSARRTVGAPRIVVVGAGGAILVSDDQGQTWKPAKDPLKQTLFSVTYGSQGFVAVGVDGAIIRSADAITWTTVVAGGADTLRAVAAGGLATPGPANAAQYVAVGASGATLTSTDGEHWHQGSSVTRLTLRAVVDTGMDWIAVGSGGIVLQAADGAHWHVVRSGTVSELFAVTDNGCNAIAVAGVDASITTTDCGRSWKLTG